jgi:transposase InsO family protein
MRLKQMFDWRGMKSDARAFVRSYLVCQQAKSDRSRLPGLLQPLPVPAAAWQLISLDFVEGLPRSGNANCILVVVDSFTKYGHFISLLHPFIAAGVAKVFLNQIYRLHGLPNAIVSDHDRLFTSHFWQELFRLVDVKLQMSTSYHPQSDGQTERLNQTMETFLRCFVNACPTKWSLWLPLAEFWYNSTPHSAINCSPFEALYGHPPRHFGISALDSVTVPELSSWLQDRRVMTELIHQHLSRAKERMKRQADKNRSERHF